MGRKVKPRRPLRWKQVRDKVLPESQEEMSLGKARRVMAKRMIKHRTKGTPCPCCGKHNQIYVRALNAAMVEQLAELARLAGPRRKWVNMAKKASKKYQKTKQLGTTAHWELVEHRPNDDPKKRTSGVWCPTELALRFLDGEVALPSHIFETSDTTLEFSNRKVYVTDIVEGFNWQKVKRGLA